MRFCRACISATLALGIGLAGLGLVAAPARAVASSCQFTISGSVWTLNADCEVTAAISVDDGVTVEGGGNTITAVEDLNGSYTGKAVLSSAIGDASRPATLNVRNLNIDTNFTGPDGKNSGGVLMGIYLLRAGGTIENVSINGISHGNGVQEGIALAIRNRDLDDAVRNTPASLAVPEASVTLRDVSISHFQKAGLLLDGNVKFSATDVTIGRGTGPHGETNDGIAANGVQISRGAHGSLTDSTVAPNYYQNPLTASATGILVWNANKVTLARDIISGAKGNEGIDVSDDGSFSTATDVTMSCSLVRITGAVTENSYGISKGDDGSRLALRDSTVTGFETSVAGATPSNGNGDCLAPAPRVKAFAGDHAVDVVWSRAAAPVYAPASGQVVVLTAPGEPDRTQTLDASADSASFTGLSAGATYTATVRVANVSGNATGSATAKIAADPAPAAAPATPAVAQKITLSRSRTSIATGHKVALTGRLTPARPGTAVQLLWFKRGDWRVLKSSVLRSDSTFRFTWKAGRVYGKHYFKVRSVATTGFLTGLSASRSVKVKRP